MTNDVARETTAKFDGSVPGRGLPSVPPLLVITSFLLVVLAGFVRPQPVGLCTVDVDGCVSAFKGVASEVRYAAWDSECGKDSYCLGMRARAEMSRFLLCNLRTPDRRALCLYGFAPVVPSF